MAGAQIFVGCGGSGAETLLRLHSLLMHDAYWRYMLSTDVYYLVVDTEQAEIKRFESEVKRMCGTVPGPCVKSVLLSQGYKNLTPIVYEYFSHPHRLIAADNGQDRLRQHWWVNGDDEPFEAPRVSPLKDGAGQCPPVSFFLSWHRMAMIKQAVDGLQEEIKSRRQHLSLPNGPLAEANVTLACSLAGGTGRGCWMPVMFAIKEAFAKLGPNFPVGPVAFFYDAAMYDAYLLSDEKRSTRLNFLTGVSELSFWMDNLDCAPGARYTYRLPNMKSPSGEELDVIKCNAEVDSGAASPVDGAYLIFGSSQNATFTRPEYAYEMVGAALYSRMSYMAIRGTSINEGKQYSCLGVSTVEVPIDALEGYFIRKARLDVAQRLASTDVSLAESIADDVLEKSGCCFEISSMCMDRFMPNEKGDFLQRALHSMGRDVADAIESHLDDAFREDSIESVLAAADALVYENEEIVRDALAKSGSAVTGPAKALEQGAPDYLKQTGSAGTLATAIEIVMGRLSQMASGLEALDDVEMEDLEKRIRDAGRRDYIAFGERFNDQEEVDLKEAFRSQSLLTNAPELARQLRGQVEKWQSELLPWLGNAEALRAASASVVGRFDADFHSRSGTYSPDDPRKGLFAFSETVEQMVTDSKNQLGHRRKLLPVWSNAYEQATAGLPDGLRDILIREMTAKALSTDDVYTLRAISKELGDGVQTYVALDREFLVEQFSLSKVLDGQLRAWHKRLDSLRGQQGKLATTMQSFERFFGF
ncbi:MAG: hypothetical protein HN341_03610, partial [Verrucomicrobia bacterium]|nr:hypothetical protein [Verrucomicrobiota bacterium]